MNLKDVVIDEYSRRFGEPPAYVVRAPGRVNLIGEHTDYNDGFVLPMAIDRQVWIALSPHPQRRVHLHSLDFEGAADFHLDHLENQDAGWVEYVRGVAWALQQAGFRLNGLQGVVAGDVPIGAGLSSSAALELATARAYCAASGLPWDPVTMARLAQEAEYKWVGMPCGIMDQLIAVAGVAGHALLIDCRSLDYVPVPLPTEATVVVLDTATRRELLDSAYDERRAQCEAAARVFGVPALRDVSPEMFVARQAQLDPIIRRRARHVIDENARTLAATRAMAANDPQRLGELMNASHASLQADFEVSSPALDTMVACARRAPGCYGARMTGAGFGGCAVALVASEAVPAFSQQVARAYREASGLEAGIYVCQAVDGARIAA